MSGGLTGRTACFGCSSVRGISINVAFQRPGAGLRPRGCNALKPLRVLAVDMMVGRNGLGALTPGGWGSGVLCG